MPTRPTADPVRIWEEPLTLPTYAQDPPESVPVYLAPELYQFASRFVYPYPLGNSLTDRREDRIYRAIYLENEYLKLCILPEIGGKLFYATDKTNGYEIFYRQRVIKPANIGMLGAWTSGGIEWCPFHHHCITTFWPAHCRLVRHPDGGATAWLGGIERIQRMKWLVGVRLYPGRSIIELDVRLFNRADLPFSMMYWENAAVYVNDDYQIFFPPSTRFAAFHVKTSFARWPVAREPFNGLDYYRRGIDISWWRNNPYSASYFAHDLTEGFMAGYDHGRRAGTAHVGDPGVLPGAKVFEWGNAEEGRMWDRVLTDSDGPYAELMIGAYSDNQPDFSWIRPHEAKVFTHVWYPLRETGGLKNANREAAVNLEVVDGRARAAFNATGRHEKARLVIAAAGRSILSETLDIDPASPAMRDVALPSGTRPADVEARLETAEGRVLVAYRPRDPGPEHALPEPVVPPPPPEAIANLEELYLAGLRVRQFHDPRFDASDYFREGLRRDPDDVRCNIQMGLDAARRGLWEEAEQFLGRAIDRLTRHFTRPRDGEAHFLRGLARRAQGRLDAARDDLHRAAWDHAHHAAAFANLAEISSRQGALDRALDEAEESLSTQGRNPRVLNLRAAVLRRLRRVPEARAAARRALDLDPLDAWSIHELRLLGPGDESAAPDAAPIPAVEDLLGDEADAYIELACNYVRAGFWDDAIEILSAAAARNRPELSNYPTIAYWLGYLHLQQGDPAAARAWFKKAAAMPLDFCFPYRLESIEVLEAALRADPADAAAHYLLGNLLFTLQPLRAIRAWEAAIAHRPDLAVAHRNLGWACYQVLGDTGRAIACYETAIRLDSGKAIYFAELDGIHERHGTPVERRLNLMERHRPVVERRFDSLQRLVIVLVRAGRYDKAIDLLRNRFFPVTEEAYGLHDIHVDAHLLRGLERLEAGRAADALADFLAAADYPENQQIGRNLHDPRTTQVLYCVGLGYEAAGDGAKARDAFARAEAHECPQTEFLYYRALALEKLGRKEEAAALVDRLIELGRQRVRRAETGRYTIVELQRDGRRKDLAAGWMMVGLGQIRKAQPDQAQDALDRAAAADPNSLWARFHRAHVLPSKSV
jgi:tetratricopeptide (TPR) repeat protein